EPGATMELFASRNQGGSWISTEMALRADWYTLREYSGTVCPADFGDTSWVKGDEIWYYVRATDGDAKQGWLPQAADPSSPHHTGGASDYLSFSVLPAYPDSSTEPRILLVNEAWNRTYDWSPCLESTTTWAKRERIYEQALTDAGYTFDKYNVGAAGTGVELNQPIWLEGYDAVVWFTGTGYWGILGGPAQRALRDFLGDGGKVVLCGETIAYEMDQGADSLGGEFLSGVMGCDYLADMEYPFTKPYLYMGASDSISVLGTPMAVDLDSLVVYRECPDLKWMDYVLTNSAPPSGYTAQPLLAVLNPGAVAEADGAIYTEYQGQGQCVFLDFDLCSLISHIEGYCSGDGAPPAPDFVAGNYNGRVELVRVILEDIFGLPSSGGVARVPEPKTPGWHWALFQNTPNPWAGSTEISFEVASSARVAMRVYNVTGQVVRTLVDEPRDPGRHAVSWDGRDAAGQRVASGVYFYKLAAGPYTATRKTIVVK
ncbi:MAG: FlgD immunoglobulin-like domain containing protein, partial [bacterium]